MAASFHRNTLTTGDLHVPEKWVWSNSVLTSTPLIQECTYN